MSRDPVRLVVVEGKNSHEWAVNPQKSWETVCVTTMLLNDWEVLAKIDLQPLTV